MAKDLYTTILIDCYGDMLTQKQKEMVELYYNEDLSLAEMSELFGITRQGVRDSIKRAEAQLLEYEAKLGFARRFAEMRQGLEEIVQHAAFIQEESSKLPYSGKIGETARRIAEMATALNT